MEYVALLIASKLIAIAALRRLIMKTLVCTYKEAQLYQIPFPKLKNEDDDYCIYSIRAEKSERYHDGIDDGLGSRPLSEGEAIAKFKDKIDKHLCA